MNDCAHKHSRKHSIAVHKITNCVVCSLLRALESGTNEMKTLKSFPHQFTKKFAERLWDI